MSAQRGGAARLLRRVIGALETLSSALLFVMMILTFVDVVGRYVLGKPVYGATELVSILLALIVFSGLGIANARDDHISVELVSDHLRRLSPRVHDVVIRAFSVLAMLLLAFVLTDLAIESAGHGARTVVLELPLYAVTACIAGLATLSLALQLLGFVVGSDIRTSEGVAS